MSKLHDPNLRDNEKNLYYFKKELVTEQLMKALNSHYNDVYNNPLELNNNDLSLIPTDPYFIDNYSSRRWVYKEKIYITQEQVDKYLLLFNVTGLSFLEYMEIILDGDT